jgi:sec-independent protein translocase protein TatC
MSVVGVLDLFRGRPRGGVGEGGRMSLGDHVRELRARLMRIALYLVVGTVIAFFFWHQLFGVIFRPYNEARQMLGGSVTTRAVITGAGGALMLQLKLCAVAALVGTSPLWLMEIWGFVVPGLHPNERRWTRVFAAVAGPLFLVGVGVGYYVLPKGLQVLISFTPAHVENLIEFGDYFTFMTRMLLVFGVAFEIPLFVVLLNLAGIVQGRTLGRYRPWIIVLTFVFAAVATPSTDPFSMLMLAVPMTALLMMSEGIARVVDRRRGARRAAAAAGGWADDEASPL